MLWTLPFYEFMDYDAEYYESDLQRNNCSNSVNVEGRGIN